MYFVYILISINTGKYYIGSTNDLEARIIKHNSGGVFWTKIYRPWSLIYCEEYNTLSQARKREYQLKSWKKRKAIENLIRKATI
ncbi:GIY-YIG nuclease family protein [Candidatus Gottesmanbacteria bacterium]|nr:GIY-YIG nuclease family protein [Candidatus Gottesmanbacteria bacterium]